MGKKGDALRAAKKNEKLYSFTRQQLFDHDQHVVDTFRRRVEEETYEKVSARMKAEFEEQAKVMDKAIQDEWDERARLFASEDAQSNFFEYLSCMLSVSVRVLIERFHWKPLDENGLLSRRLRIVRFSDFVHEEIEKISGDEMQDIRKYNEETFRLYGIRFGTEEQNAEI